LEVIDNRSYKGKSITTSNEKDLDVILQTRKKMGSKPIIVIMHASNPAVVAEFEKQADGIFVHFGVQDQALMDLISGVAEPSGLLPIQLPANMETVETQMEDVPHDMEVHVDTEGNAYNFAFGLSWSGVIRDERTQKYGKY